MMAAPAGSVTHRLSVPRPTWTSAPRAPKVASDQLIDSQLLGVSPGLGVVAVASAAGVDLFHLAGATAFPGTMRDVCRLPFVGSTPPMPSLGCVTSLAFAGDGMFHGEAVVSMCVGVAVWVWGWGWGWGWGWVGV